MNLKTVTTVDSKFGKVIRKVADEHSDKLKAALYNSLRKHVARKLKSMYPTCTLSVDDVASDIYVNLLRPKTPKEYRDKLKAEDAANGTTHSREWYMYEQTKYPKVIPFDWFDPEKSPLESYASTQADQGIFDLMIKDPALKYNRETRKFEKVASLASMDNTSLNSDGEAVSAAQLEADKQANTSQHHDSINPAEYIKMLYSMTPAQRGQIKVRLQKALGSQYLSGSDRKALEKILKALDTDEEAAPTINKSGTERIKRGTGNFAKSGSLAKMVNDEFPFGVEPKLVRSSDHTAKLKFTFGSKEEASEMASKYESEMDAKGLKCLGVRGTSLLYVLK